MARILSLVSASWMAALGALLTLRSPAETRYVDGGSTNPTPPYTNWATAAGAIQDAIDAAVAGDDILVTNGVYRTGGRIVFGRMTNRVAVIKPITVRSVNGPEVTVIEGRQVFASLVGDAAVRCVYLTNGATLAGFTLTNGATRGTGNVVREQNGGGVWCESASAVVSNCLVTGNAAISGGGAFQGTLVDCILRGNWAFQGGGAYSNNLNRCTLFSNTAAYIGGGADFSTLNNCSLYDNTAGPGSGGDTFGGGAHSSVLNNCILSRNSAVNGGGTSRSTLNNCTVHGNRASGGGGGAHLGAANNCILYYNVAPNGPNSLAASLNYCCTTPLPTDGIGNLAAEPQLVDFSHLGAGSPCRAAGNSAHAKGLDIDGESWAGLPSIGCDEYVAPGAAGPLTVRVEAAYTNAAAGFQVRFEARIEGHASAIRWDFADGTVLSDQIYASHSWTQPGDYTVVLRAYNQSYPDGVSAAMTVHVEEARIHYVALGSTNPAAPYASWVTAATNIQDAVDAATLPGSQVLVSDGVYDKGGRLVGMTNRLAVDKPVTVRSLNGPAATIIRGFQVPGATNGNSAVRCVYLAAGAALAGFTLTNGATGITGQMQTTAGGVWCGSSDVVLSNCVIIGNTAFTWAGGVYWGTLINCVVSSNTTFYGGGAYCSTLNNCELTGNRAFADGGGANSCALNNCKVTGNRASFIGGGAMDSTLDNCWIIGNSASASGSASYGGGVYRSTLNNCILSRNSAAIGAGASHGKLNNCTLTANTAASVGGGTYEAILNNCISIYNSAAGIGSNHFASTLSYCCTEPVPEGDVRNFTNAPVFIDLAADNLRLQSNSPCINSGRNGYVRTASDPDGMPRIAGGTVDVGAYEFQTPASLVSLAWLLRNSLPTDGTADYADADGDGLNNWEEWFCDTNPTNAVSVLRLLDATPGGMGVVLRWASVSGRTYFLERSADLGAQPPFLTVTSNVPGQAGTTTYTDSGAPGSGPVFYRVGVQD